MMIRVYGLSVRSRPAALALAAAALAVGAVFVAFGIFLLLGLAALGTVVGAGVLAFRALTGRRGGRLRSPQPDLNLDPALEVFPSESTSQPPPHNSARLGSARSQAHKPPRSQA
jgi:hypothetical protein